MEQANWMLELLSAALETDERNRTARTGGYHENVGDTAESKGDGSPE